MSERTEGRLRKLTRFPAVHRRHGSSHRFTRCRRPSGLLLTLRRHRLPHIVKLHTAVPAMVKVRAPNALREIDEALLHRIDLVARRHARQPIRPAPRTARVIAQIQRVPARLGLARLALPALVHRVVQHLFMKGSVDAPQSSLTSRTVEHFVLFYTAIAPATQPVTMGYSLHSPPNKHYAPTNLGPQ